MATPAISVAALVLSVIALQRSGARPTASGAEAPATVSAAPPPVVRGPWPKAPVEASPRAPVVAPPSPVPMPAPPASQSGDRRPGRSASAAVTSLAAKLRVRADVLAELADASGELPKPLEARLLRAQARGQEIAARHTLDARRGDDIANVLVDHVLRTLREARGPDPDGPVDPDREAEIRRDTMASIRIIAGPDAPTDAAALDGL